MREERCLERPKPSSKTQLMKRRGLDRGLVAGRARILALAQRGRVLELGGAQLAGYVTNASPRLPVTMPPTKQLSVGARAGRNLDPVSGF
jgi:hypothetical protein